MPSQPEPPRIATSDVTPEKLGVLLAKNPKGLACFRDELSGWLGGMNRYAKGEGERSFWTEAYGARPYTIDRVKVGGSIHIPRLAVPVFGTIQPERLQTILFEGDDDGLASRFIWVWPEPLPPRRPHVAASGHVIRTAFARLGRLKPGQSRNRASPHLDAT